MRITVKLVGWCSVMAITACGGGGGGGGDAAAGGGAGSGGANVGPERAALVTRIDSIINAPITAGKLVGASIAVVRGTDTIAVKGYGKANLELDVPTPPRATYEIGSVTKQFTGAAIMQLVEQGKLSLNDDLQQYVKHDTKGRKIPIWRLLDHTSGIKGYTEIPEFGGLLAETHPRDTLLKLVASKPFDFEPGDEQIYNNSAFFLAGLIIEKVTGQRYEDYVQQQLFDKAGMKGAHYCSERTIHKNKATGYDSDSAGPVQKGPISHLWPYAAGSLCSSAIDLVAWNEALHQKGTILGAEAYKEFITPGKLNDGNPVGYSKGIATYDRLGRRALHHGGGIPGFLSQNLYFPAESLSVIVLFNTAGPANPDAAAEAIAEAVLGKAPDAAKPVEGDLARFAGTYAGRGRGRATELTVSVDNGALMVKSGFPGDSARALTYVGDNTFAREYTRYIFAEQGGRVTAVRQDAGYGSNLLLRK
jgi:CubicO group peptidase (beta-lactamase class C family)